MRALLPFFAAVVALTLAAAAPARADGPVVFAAASTARALDAALAAYDGDAVASYASSGALARQIEQGAPADLFLSANPDWMAYVEERGLIGDAAPSALLSNRLVVIAAADAPEIGDGLTAEALAARLEGERFAMADPVSAPVGRYGQAALETLGLWSGVAPKLVPTKDTRATVALVARGEAALGLVYASDAAGAEGVRVSAELPRAAHPPIRYLIAPVADGPDPEGAAALLAFLTGAEAAEIFARFGFVAAASTEVDPEATQ